ncbi:Fcf2 pre-rRNA processing-domain-containing protein [Radiomyces spectabilis]|uniref:Fcf2 pre-rRNA processing-domain-containing protein n=1 Tax=Radiomyces spectabilis TaxID=64574 RepID=UPI00222038D4|nr:Fcf2 pre-rRNA processing-domain-containing protein [Radiomyces spectabilis]KAI8380969.1 Fcf2 pre-rRNA processing-domain-containing protein [Radiomyces spectabilis]
MPLTRARLRKLEQETHTSLQPNEVDDTVLSQAASTSGESTTQQAPATVSAQRKKAQPKRSGRKSKAQSDEPIPQSNGEKENLESFSAVVETTESKKQALVQESEEQSDEESEEESEDESEEESGEESEGENVSSDEESSDDEDLDSLLDKARTALEKQRADVTKDDDASSSSANKFSFPKLDAGVSIEDHLYIKTQKDRARLTSETVSIINPGDKAPAKGDKVIETHKVTEKEEKPLSRKERQQLREKTTGKGWFDMEKPEITPEIKRDLQILKMRHVLDRKRHYKKMGKRADPTYFQVGTVVEGPTEFFSARMTNRERKNTILDELLSDDNRKQYYKRKFLETQERTSSGGKKHYKKQKVKRY